MKRLTAESECGVAMPAPAWPINVYKFVTRFGWGGTEMQVLGLAEQFDPARHNLAFGCLRRDGGAEPGNEDQGWSITEFPLSRFASATAGRQMLRLVRELRMHKTQVLHSYNFYANVFSIPAARMAGVPCIIASIRDMGVYLTPRQRQVQRWVCRLADRVVVNADAIRNWLISDGYPAAKIHVIRNGARIPVFDKKAIRMRVRSELGIPDAGKVVMMVARLNPKKGVEDLIEAAALVLKDFPDTWFVIVGEVVLESTGQEKAYANRLVARARELGLGEHIVFTGLRRDIPRLLPAADLSVLPSFSEGLPNAVIEAMASGLPVVATNVGGIPEIIRQGRTGLLVTPGDIRALAESINTVLQNPFLARRLGEAARARIQDGFSFEKMFRETTKLYQTVLDEKGLTPGWRLRGERRI